MQRKNAVPWSRPPLIRRRRRPAQTGVVTPQWVDHAEVDPAPPQGPPLSAKRAPLCAAHDRLDDQVEIALAQSAHAQAQRDPRSGRIVESPSTITDRAYVALYPDAPSPIPEDFRSDPNCVKWATTWWRIRSIIVALGGFDVAGGIGGLAAL